MRVLVVEDETRMAGLLKRGLEEEGHAVDVAGEFDLKPWDWAALLPVMVGLVTIVFR